MRHAARWMVLGLLPACAPAPAPAPSATPPASTAAPPGSLTASAARFDESPSRATIDAQLRAWERRLPAAETLSQQNGASIRCRSGEHATLTLLGATAARVKIERPVDLVALAPWARHGDACIRQIALDVIVPATGHDRDRLSVPPMHEVDHFQYHDIFVSLKQHLDRAKVAYDPAIFDGLMLDVRAEDFARITHGRWAEPASPGKNFRYLVEIDATSVRVTHAHSPPDPSATDHTWTTKIASVALTERLQLEVTGSTAVESSSKGYVGEEQPAPFVHAFWPVAPGILWFRRSADAYWEKLERQAGP